MNNPYKCSDYYYGRRLLSLAVFIMLFLSLLASSLDLSTKAYACEVGTPGPPSEALNDSATVFTGTVVEIQNFTVQGSTDTNAVFFDVRRYWKALNDNDYKQLILFSEINDGASCGYPFEKGKTYLVYATTWHRDPNSLYTSSGMRTQLIENAQKEDLAFLGEGKAPTKQLSWDDQINGIRIQPIPTGQEQQAISTTLSIIGIGAVIAGAVAFFSLRRLKEKK